MSDFIPGGDLSSASIATCATCERTGLLDAGAPGPQEWLDLQVWNGSGAENYSAEISRARVDE
jgi:hypothetical protein